MYAVHEQFDAHRAANAWLDERLAGDAAVGLPWSALLAFVRLSANPRIVPRPLTFDQAFGVVDGWLGVPVVWVPQPGEGHATLLRRLLDGEAKPDLVPDAHLAALAIEHGLHLCSTDRDFARFDGLRWSDPLRDSG